MTLHREVTAVGGCGHVGFPLVTPIQHRCLFVVVHDINVKKVATVSLCEMSFDESTASERPTKVAANGCLVDSVDSASVAPMEHILEGIRASVDETESIS